MADSEPLDRLTPLLDDGDRVVVIDIAGREALSKQVTSETRAEHRE